MQLLPLRAKAVRIFVALACAGTAFFGATSVAHAVTYDETNACGNPAGPDVYTYLGSKTIAEGTTPVALLRLRVVSDWFGAYPKDDHVGGRWCAYLSYAQGFSPTAASVKLTVTWNGVSDSAGGTGNGNSNPAIVKTENCVRADGHVVRGSTVDATATWTYCFRDTPLNALNPSYKEDAIHNAKGQFGVPYVWGGQSPRGFDCSGLVIWSFQHTSHPLIPVGTDTTADGLNRRISNVSNPVPGDLVFFVNSAGRTFHVGIYIGDGQMIVASFGHDQVMQQSIYAIGASKIQFGRT